MGAKKLKIGIIGLGSVGLILAVHLKEAGCEVAICDYDKDKMNLIRQDGVKLIGHYQKSCFFDYNYSSVQELLDHGVDVIISAVKSYRVETILNQVEKYQHNNVYVMCAQNGIDITNQYISHFNESQLLRMVINFAGVLNAPNVSNVTFFAPPNYIASINDSNPEISSKIAELLSSVGMDTKNIDSFSLTNHVWEKMILIASISPLCGISNLNIKEAMSNSETLEIVEQLIFESLEVAKAEGVKFRDNISRLLLRSLKNAGTHLPSIAVDMLNGRETEIDYINGKIVEYGRKHYIQTPLNLIFTNLVKAITKKSNSNGIK
ncbi:MAG: ketopantoate reductase family protein [Candidatus Kapabacteria bacterium]|nr:ketopantoate reductase family protein [Candidatus Kapabacteria bacterium]